MPEQSIFKLRHQLSGIGIVSVTEQDRVIDVARRCMATGAVVGAGWAVVGAPALAPGVVSGFLSGFVTGTATCTGLSYGAKNVLKKIGTGEVTTP